ncbi:hypothetical protein M431DRAFT_206602 [Trichoderma harzianum CBS 226.95]|uniref:Uncharacterized protein n=1 Tax=Trichoderma harzianum CBS 226.95 TaxID=983964 RepID=A0A2T4AW18_TRIHA|nr:hypothetical protein M431DRAFT_206602 [Trichoderma harzianum CBS 226.95]PTB61229.1 hypothetical protein M431DRAFT_206602 [Trichoderma harzianum CBS 226.95]
MARRHYPDQAFVPWPSCPVRSYKGCTASGVRAGKQLLVLGLYSDRHRYLDRLSRPPDRCGTRCRFVAVQFHSCWSMEDSRVGVGISVGSFSSFCVSSEAGQYVLIHVIVGKRVWFSVLLCYVLYSYCNFKWGEAAPLNPEGQKQGLVAQQSKVNAGPWEDGVSDTVQLTDAANTAQRPTRFTLLLRMSDGHKTTRRQLDQAVGGSGVHEDIHDMEGK